ncbi:hypothetical protein K5Q02_05845 [Pseudomonas sp. MM211]|uniref:hypothetical protein n=1 Tax=Pseudomonas sp. MM211 TaxID=2866808 RepID=UPI001CEDD1F6|nr:hypothetical protein [Pseudomonas sp. MM211]UCJ17893.1 hypothetical protein K5Q02_05845 [Pseudomonas sp. MM211]
MHSNPYAITQVESGLSGEARQSSGLPMRLLLTAMLCCAAGLTIHWIIMWLTLGPEYLQAYLNDLWPLATSWLTALAVDGCSALLLTRYYLQRHNLVTVTRPGRLIALFVGFYFVAFTLVSLFFRLLWIQLITWIYESDFGISPRLLVQPVNLLLFVLAVLLPLWLSLHLMRRTAQVESGLGRVGRGETALAFGLLFCVIYMKLLTLLPIGVINPYGMEWLQAVGSASGLMYGLIALLAARGALPPQLPQLAVGRLLASVLVCMGIWLVVATVLCVVLLVVLYSGSEFMAMALVVLFGLLLMALLWPLTRLSLRWVYRPAPA